jgi:membrane-bound lytic murein transglycosylase D
MRSHTGVARGGIAVLAGCLTWSCASTPTRVAPSSTTAPAVSPDDRTMSSASEQFALGRDAALAGDFGCARYHFSLSIAAVRPAAGPAPSPAVRAFSYELYEGIQRYEALAGATEEAGTSHGEVAPELAAQIEAPAASPEAIASARTAVDSEPPAVSDVPIVVNDAVLRLLAAFQSDGLHDKIAAGLARSGRYVPMIQRIFEEEGLPRDLAMIAFIESSFLPQARSYMSAHGIWQFMPRTGRQYGLRFNGVIDERSDPEKATRAAARYLAYLYEIFDDWYLAMAAYNAGEGKILRAMQKTGADDFWQLAATRAIRPQTKNYVPAFLAAVLISKNPSHYGFDVILEPPLEHETIRLDRPVSLEHLAGGAALPLGDLQGLNPELRSLLTPHQPEGYDLKIPTGTREALLAAFAAAPTAQPPAFKTTVARKGDTLKRIARRYGVPVSAVASANALSTRSRVARGQEILIPEKAAAASKASRTKSGAKAAKARTSAQDGSHKNYKVKTGDTLYQIAVRHGTTVAEILAINGLGGSAIKAGDRLKIPAK